MQIQLVNERKFSPNGKGCVEIYLNEEDMFGSQDDNILEFEEEDDQNGRNYFEDDDLYMPKMNSMLVYENHDNPLNEMND